MRAPSIAPDGHGPAESADLYEMANLYPEDTGLPMTVWVSPRGNARHDARVKVCRVHGNRMVPDDTAVVGLRPEPRLIEGTLRADDLAPVLRWAAANRDVLMDYWEGRIGTGAMVGRLVPVPPPSP